MNEAMRDYWNGDVGRTWVDMQARMDAALAPVAAALLDVAAARPGEAALDIGCGSGVTTLALAAAVAPGGSVLGADISAPLLELARARAAAARSPAVFVEADVATYDGGMRFDLIVSRFGVMFFDNPPAAFTHLHGRAAPGGRLAFACWRAPADNLWATLPLHALADRMPPPAPADPHAPGPFAFADADRVCGILSRAGWHDAAAEPLDFTMRIGSSADPAADAADFSLRIGPAARAIADAGSIDRDDALPILAAAMAAHAAGGVVALPAGVWIVTARA